jgi:hypothetical protein
VEEENDLRQYLVPSNRVLLYSPHSVAGGGARSLLLVSDLVLQLQARSHVVDVYQRARGRALSAHTFSFC